MVCKHWHGLMGTRWSGSCMLAGRKIQPVNGKCLLQLAQLQSQQGWQEAQQRSKLQAALYCMCVSVCACICSYMAG